MKEPYFFHGTFRSMRIPMASTKGLVYVTLISTLFFHIPFSFLAYKIGFNPLVYLNVALSAGIAGYVHGKYRKSIPERTSIIAAYVTGAYLIWYLLCALMDQFILYNIFVLPLIYVVTKRMLEVGARIKLGNRHQQNLNNYQK